MTIEIIASIPNPAQLPATYAIYLNDFSAISLSGEEQSKYLQGQVTCDVNAVNDTSLSLGAHCDAKGKVLSVFRLINRDGEHLLLQEKSSIELSIAALQKFGVFAKVTISKTENLSFYALVGEQAASLMQKNFHAVPDSLSSVIQAGSTTLVYLAGKQERYLIIDNTEVVNPLIETLALPVYNHNVWQLAEINEGFPLLAEQSLEQYVPQMLNLQAINGISFTKGCYLGQETVARMQYLGKNKRALFALEGSKPATDICAGDIIEKQLGENWRKAGDVLAVYCSDEQINVQAVLANDVDNDTIFRLKKQPDIQLSLKELPYSLTQED